MGFFTVKQPTIEHRTKTNFPLYYRIHVQRFITAANKVQNAVIRSRDSTAAHYILFYFYRISFDFIAKKLAFLRYYFVGKTSQRQVIRICLYNCFIYVSFLLLLPDNFLSCLHPAQGRATTTAEVFDERFFPCRRARFFLLHLSHRSEPDGSGRYLCASAGYTALWGAFACRYNGRTAQPHFHAHIRCGLA